MAETARTEQDSKEFFDDPDILDKKVTKLSELLSKSKHCVVFTGAGISTSTGIKDFRSGVDTKLETGAGIWAIEAAQIKGVNILEKEKDIVTTSMMSAIPSLSHMAIVALMNKNLIHFCISQNVDGLHIRSGVSRNKIAELHGNTTIEICEKCNTVYQRDFDVIRPQLHFTGRKCSIQNCKGDLYDTIVNFGENLPETELNAAQNNTKQGDLCISLGSSLTVRPACQMAQHFGDEKKKDLVIVNLQKTPLDDIATVRIFAKIDDVIGLVCKKLKCEIPKWKLQRYIQLSVDNDNKILNVLAMDEDWNIPSSIFKSIILSIGNTMQFVGDSKWLDIAKNEYRNKQNISADDELLQLTKALRKCDKSLKRYAKMIYDSGYHTIDSLKEFRMDKAVDIMEGSNNYERRKIVNTFSKPLVKDMDELIDTTVQFIFDINTLNINANDDEQKKDEKVVVGDYIEFEFAKNYNEPNLKLSLCKYIKANQNEYKFNMTYELDKNEWTAVTLLNN
eukprot:239110_1